MKANQRFIDIPEFDEFFRRGDEPIHSLDTLQPVAETQTDVESDSRVVRTPAQVERRARFIRLVSVMMAFLSVGSASAFTYKAVLARKSTSNLAMYAKPSGGPAAQAHVGPEVQLLGSQVVVEGNEHRSDLQAKAVDVSVQPAQSNEPTIRLSARTEPVQSAAPVPPEPQMRTAAAESRSTPEPKSAPAAKPRADGARGTAQPAPSKPAIATIAAAQPAVAKPARAKAAVAKPVPAKPAVAMTAVTKKVGPKPADYHPPTASFSD